MLFRLVVRQPWGEGSVVQFDGLTDHSHNSSVRSLNFIMCTLTHHTNYDPEGGVNVYLRNFSITAYLHRVQIIKRRLVSTGAATELGSQ
jgi:hypothetical protein